MTSHGRAAGVHTHTALALRELAALPGGLFPCFGRLRRAPYPWLLESARADARLGRFSFAGADPYLVLRVFGAESVLELRRDVRPDLRDMPTHPGLDPLELVRALLPPRPGAAGLLETPPFAGGAVGFFGHELASQIEKLSFHGRDELGLPDLCLLFVDRLLAYDHLRGRGFVLALGFATDRAEAQARAEHAANELAEIAVAGTSGDRSERAACASPVSLVASPLFDESTYGKHVATVKDHIAAGDLYQACLTHRIEVPFSGDPFQIYTQLRHSNPSPFAAYLELPELALVGSSPERFLRLTTDRRVESRPIKGTRPRGASASQDARLRAELLTSAKDRAENVMIVDLVRNDLGRVCETGSVEVEELCVAEDHASVFQLVSTVTGRLREDRDLVDLLRACFPPGSMTGAPKLAALRILDRLEPVRRGPYGGALGYLDFRGGADLCVVIRTLLVQRGRAFVHTGGGVVADSEPAAEWREAELKARALLAALARASHAGSAHG